MPYPGISNDKTAKMDSCVGRVRKTGKSKDSAIAICHDSVMGKKEAMSVKEWDDLSDEQVDGVIQQALDDADESRHEKGYVPYGVTSFKDLENYRKAQEQAHAVYTLTGDFEGLVSSIMEDPTITDKAGAIRSVANDFASRIEKPPMEAKETETEEEEKGFLRKIIDSVAETFGLRPKEQQEEPDEQAMMIWKEQDGSYRWIARYSNNFRDDDRPSEIISDQSHRRFVDMVDKGLYPKPELWLWHRPEWKCGVSDAVAYDDSGFAVATGHFDKGKEDVAEWLSKQKNVAVSHAMPPRSIARDPNDSSVLLEHQTVEISPLPLWAAANKHTGFVVVQDAQKEADMAIPKKKRDALIKEWTIDPALLDRLEAENAADAEKALQEGRDSKEQSDAVAEGEVASEKSETTSEQVAQVSEETPAAATEPEKVAENKLEQPPSRQEIADAFSVIFTEMKETMEQIAEKVGALENEVKEMRASDTERIEKAATNTPSASLAALISSRVIGRQETAVDGRSSLAKSKPEEAPASDSQRVGIPFIDRMIENK